MYDVVYTSYSNNTMKTGRDDDDDKVPLADSAVVLEAYSYVFLGVTWNCNSFTCARSQTHSRVNTRYTGSVHVVCIMAKVCQSLCSDFCFLGGLWTPARGSATGSDGGGRRAKQACRAEMKRRTGREIISHARRVLNSQSIVTTACLVRVMMHFYALVHSRMREHVTITKYNKRNKGTRSLSILAHRVGTLYHLKLHKYAL